MRQELKDILIIVEGNDGTGKTTLIKKLMQDLKITSVIHTTQHDNRKLLWFDSLLNTHNIIFDRSFISNPIYDKVFKREPTLDTEDYEWLRQRVNDLIKEKRAVVIICELDNIVHDKHELQSIIDAREEIDKYFKQVIKDNENYLVYNRDTKTYETLIEEIKQGLTQGGEVK